MSVCLVALGGNVGPVAETFARALDGLAAVPGLDVIAVGRCFLTAPVGQDAGTEYLNSATALRSELPPLELLAATKQVESDLGRNRTDRWAPRTIDLDLITCGDAVVDSDRLQLPHPACWDRRFVLDPLCRIAATTRHPARDLTFGQLRERLLPRPLPVWIESPGQEVLIESLSPKVPQVEWVSHPEAIAECGLSLPVHLPEGTTEDMLTAALGRVELADEIPGWPEQALA